MKKLRRFILLFMAFYGFNAMAYYHHQQAYMPFGPTYNPMIAQASPYMSQAYCPQQSQLPALYGRVNLSERKRAARRAIREAKDAITDLYEEIENDYVLELEKSLDGSKLKDEPEGVAEAIADYIKEKRDSWNECLDSSAIDENKYRHLVYFYPRSVKEFFNFIAPSAFAAIGDPDVGDPIIKCLSNGGVWNESSGNCTGKVDVGFTQELLKRKKECKKDSTHIWEKNECVKKKKAGTARDVRNPHPPQKADTARDVESPHPPQQAGTARDVESPHPPQQADTNGGGQGTTNFVNGRGETFTAPGAGTAGGGDGNSNGHQSPATSSPDANTRAPDSNSETQEECTYEPKHWQKDENRVKKKYRKNGKVSKRHFCNAFSNRSQKTECKEAIKNIKEALKEIKEYKKLQKEARKELREIKKEEFERKYGNGYGQTEAGSAYCVNCGIKQTSNWDKVKDAALLISGFAVARYGIRAGRQAQESANETLALQGFPAENNFGYTLAGASLGMPFINAAIYGRSQGNRVFGGFMCAPSPTYY